MELKEIIGGLGHYFNNSAVPLKVLLKIDKLDEVKKCSEKSKQMFCDGMQRLENLAEDVQLQAHIEDLRITAEKTDWNNLDQLEQLTFCYRKVKEIYSVPV